MHEVGLMQTALEVACDHAARAGAVRIHRIRLRVGALSGVVPEALEIAFAAAAPGTLADQAELVIEQAPVVCVCDECGAEFSPEEVVYHCPICEAICSRVLTGRELELASLEVS
jgi:hydrogenase nickel incorporation protein HypA/HybF